MNDQEKARWRELYTVALQGLATNLIQDGSSMTANARHLARMAAMIADEALRVEVEKIGLE